MRFQTARARAREAASIERRETMTRKTYSEDFERVWRAYPAEHRGGKSAAFRAWERLREAKELPTPEELIETFEIHRARDRQWERGFIPHLSTYLNQGRYEDGIVELELERREKRAAEPPEPPPIRDDDPAVLECRRKIAAGELPSLESVISGLAMAMSARVKEAIRAAHNEDFIEAVGAKA
jgi:hypothetical protein